MSRSHHDALFLACIASPERADDWLFPLFPELKVVLTHPAPARPGRRRGSGRSGGMAVAGEGGDFGGPRDGFVPIGVGNDEIPGGGTFGADAHTIKEAKLEAVDPTILSETLHRRIPDVVWRNTSSGVYLVAEHQTRPDPTLGWRLFRSAALLMLNKGRPKPPPVICLAIVRDGGGEPRFPDYPLAGAAGVVPYYLNLRTADLERCRPGVARCCLRLLRAAIPAYLGTIWETLAQCWVEAAQRGATVTELRQMEHYVLEVTNRRPSRREEELLAAAQVEVIKWFPEGRVGEVSMGK